MLKIRSSIFVTLLCLALCLVIGSTSSVYAQEPVWSHKAYLTFSRPIEIPGRLLPPGTYVFRLAVPENHIGQVLNADETEVLGIFSTLTTDRKPLRPLESDVRLEPRQKGDKVWDRVLAWFSLGETVGDEISYDEHPPVEP